MTEDEQQRNAGAAPGGQPESAAGSAAQPAITPNDVTIPPNINPGYPPQPAGGYPLPQPPTFPPPGYSGPQYPGSPQPPYSYGPLPYPYSYPTPQPPVTVATLPPWLPPAPQPRQPAAPFPLAVTVIVGAAAVLVPALAYLIRVFALKGDWSSGAQLAGILAAVGLAIAVVVALIRLIGGRRTALFIVLTLVLLAVLGSTSVGAFAMSNPLHRLQAQNYESQDQWDAAIHEYKLYGESGANSGDIARIYDEWGEQLLGQQSYSDAVDRFLTVLTDYRSNTSAVARAHRDLCMSYVACYFAVGQADLGQQNCTDAVTTYKTLVSKYGDTPEAAKARSALAAPQNVTGTMSGLPTNPVPTAHLSRSINPPQFKFSDEYSTTPDAKTGNFTFKKVKQGKYYVSASRPVPGAIDYSTWYTGTTKTNYAFVVVGPLCPTDAGIFPFK